VHCTTCFVEENRLGPDGRNPDCRVCFPQPEAADVTTDEGDRNDV
jgi:hypothetical protein